MLLRDSFGANIYIHGKVCGMHEGHKYPFFLEHMFVN
jgi:hypothetical protein